MNNLKTFQTALQSYVLTNQSNGSDRRNIYKNAYYIRLKDSMACHYPKLKSIMGDDPFNGMAQAYLQQHPSHEFSINEIGKNLAEFLDHIEAVHKAYVELAQFEWLLHKASLSNNAEYQLNLEFNTLDHFENNDKHLIEKLNQPETILIWQSDNETRYESLNNN